MNGEVTSEKLSVWDRWLLWALSDNRKDVALGAFKKLRELEGYRTTKVLLRKYVELMGKEEVQQAIDFLDEARKLVEVRYPGIARAISWLILDLYEDNWDQEYNRNPKYDDDEDEYEGEDEDEDEDDEEDAWGDYEDGYYDDYKEEEEP